jgi:peptidoglycan/xylan/chitin deacetylase (PgdA/CDA1 family)
MPACRLAPAMTPAWRKTARHSTDQARTARLLLARELAGGVVAREALGSPALGRDTLVCGVPGRGVRVLQQVRYKLGRLGYLEQIAPQQQRARAALTSEGAADAPRLLVRVDEFPHYQAWDEPGRFATSEFERFHEIMAGAGVPYLIAALPRVSRQPLSPRSLGTRPLDDGEVEMLRRLEREGVALALHGLDHRTRHTSSRRRSELCGLNREATEALLERASGELASYELTPPRVFVAPYNRFDATQIEVLAERFAVVCGGPESIGTMGFQSTPQWRGETVYLPSYAPFYGHAIEVLAALERGIEQIAGLWAPITLHWGWEAEAGWSDLERLAASLARYAVPWQEFLDAVEFSRGVDHGRQS